MKKIIIYFLTQTKRFFVNPYWIDWRILIFMIPTFILNALVWYLWARYYQDLIGVVPIGYAAAVALLNIFLGGLSYRKEILVTFVLLGTGLLIQTIYIIFLKFFAMTQAF